MELIISSLLTYWGLITSWWWILLAVASVILVISFSLQEDDRALSITKAIQLSLVGILGLIPVVKNLVSIILKLDFKTRWILLGTPKFSETLLALIVVSFLSGPSLLILAVGEKLFKNFTNSSFALDVKRYGLKEAVHLMKYRKNYKPAVRKTR